MKTINLLLILLPPAISLSQTKVNSHDPVWSPNGQDIVFYSDYEGEYESRYDNSLKYVLLPEASKKGYNSNSYFRGALEYSGLIDSLEVPSCFKSPAYQKGKAFLAKTEPIRHQQLVL